ncbi:MAG: Bll2902 protein [uncultured Thiotrichaceae bacterium]|uniref:Bll2902 protein n=1 Tax=uncultured Thiotrichaceae bacterium TaxID=298394 RepID=A0A6S6SLM6_9GAMM|nr:MAG: Bll2902 protein [uncultured Thiotrichaceae bacterium]
MPRVTFKNSDGLQLSGVLHKPSFGKPIAYALFAHCFTCTKNIKAAVHIADALSRKGIAVLRFDFTGLGQSEGEFADSNFSSNMADLMAAATFLTEKHQAPEILIGHSLGGTAVLAAAKHIESAKAVATIGSPADAAHILHLFSDHLEQLESDGESDVNIGGRPFKVRKSFIDDVNAQDVRERIGGLRKALLVMHSPHDEIVNIEQASEIFVNAKHPKSFVTLDDADHLLTNEADSRYAASVLAAWASRYIDDSEPGDRTYPEYEKGVTQVRAAKKEGFLCTVNSNGHLLLGDEPLSYGGSNLGAAPFDFMATALGACTAMTLNMYARHKQLPIDLVEVATRHQKIPAADCESCETKKGKVDRFEREIRITGDITPEQKARMVQIADRCPVHKSLHSEILVTTTLADEDNTT